MKNNKAIYIGLLILLLVGCAKQEVEVSIESQSSSSLEESMDPVDSEPEKVVFPDFNTIAFRQEDGELYYGVIDGGGRVIVPFQYERIEEWKRGYLAMKKEKHGYEEVALDFDGKPAHFAPVEQGRKYRQIGNGDFYLVFSQDHFDIIIYRSADDQEMLTLSGEGDFQAYEIMDTTGKRRLLFKIDEAAEYYMVLYDADRLLSCSPEEAAEAKLAEHKVQLHFYGFFNAKTKPHEHLVFSVNNDGRQEYGMIDLDGNVILEPTYTFLDNGADWKRYDLDMIVASDKNGMTGYIDKEGNTMIPFQYMEAEPFYKGFAAVKLNEGMIGIINKAGEEIWRSKDKTKVLNYSFRGSDFAMASDDWSIIKYDGTVIDLKTMFDDKIIDDGVYNFYPIWEKFVLVKRRLPHDIYQHALLDPESGEWVIPLSEKQTGSEINMDTKATYFEYVDSDMKILYNWDGKEITSGYDRLVTAIDGLYLLETGGIWYWYDESGQVRNEFPRPEVLEAE